MSQYGQSAYPTTGSEPTQVAGGQPPYGTQPYAGQPYAGQPASFGPQPGYPYGGGPGQPGGPYGQPGGQPGRNRTKIIVAAVVAVLLIAGGAVGLVLGLSGGDKKSEVQTQPKPPVASSTVPDKTPTDKTPTDKTSTDKTPTDSGPSDTTSGDTTGNSSDSSPSPGNSDDSTTSSDDTGSSDTSSTDTGSTDTSSTDTDPTTTAADLEACQAAIPAIQTITDGASSTQLAAAATKVNRAAGLADNPDLRNNLQAIAGTYQDAADGNRPDTSKLYEEGYQVGQICRAAGYSG